MHVGNFFWRTGVRLKKSIFLEKIKDIGVCQIRNPGQLGLPFQDWGPDVHQYTL